MSRRQDGLRIHGIVAGYGVKGRERRSESTRNYDVLWFRLSHSCGACSSLPSERRAATAAATGSVYTTDMCAFLSHRRVPAAVV